MVVKQISVSFNRTIQWRQFEPVNIFAGCEAEVTEKEDLEEAYAGLYNIVKREVTDRIEKILEAKEKREKEQREKAEEFSKKY
ncbi:MAG: hypothetical protein AABY22_20300 [Nanoarchaeota archaeon]